MFIHIYLHMQMMISFKSYILHCTMDSIPLASSHGTFADTPNMDTLSQSTLFQIACIHSLYSLDSIVHLHHRFYH